jgi:Fungal protein of unknown function (DUF1752)/Nitrogen regulatory protein AreA N terminus
MAVATQAERGGCAAIGAAGLQPGADDSTPMDETDQFYYSPPDDTYQAVSSRHPSPETLPDARVTSKFTSTATGGGKLDLSTQDAIARHGLLQDSAFPDWEDEAVRSGLESPDEMQRKDPLGTQIWKLYSKTKTRLPNQERMENLTWRMMAMNLKRREQKQAMSVSRCRAFHDGSSLT